MIHIISLLSLEALVLVSLVSRKWENLVKNFLSMKSSSLNLDEMSIYTNKESWGHRAVPEYLEAPGKFEKRPSEVEIN
jgi:tRNA G37 N-methylase TrmD